MNGRTALTALFLLVSIAFGQNAVPITNVSAKVQLDTNLPHLAKGPLAPGWEKRIVYSAESDKRLFWVASCGEPKWTEIRGKADSTLVKRDSAAVPFLLTKLSDDDARKRQTVNQILKKIGKHSVKPLLVVLDTTKDNDVATLALQTLGDIGDSSATPMLIKTSRDTSGRLRSAAVGALMTMPAGSNVIVNRIRELSLDPWSGIRRSAIRGLVLQSDLKSIPTIVNSLSDSVWAVRETVLQALLVRPNAKDSAKAERINDIARFRKALRDTLEERLLPDWTTERFIAFRTGFGPYPYVRMVRKEELNVKGAKELSLLLQAYRILGGEKSAIWKRAAKHPAAVVRAEALYAGIHKKPDGKYDVDGFAKPLLDDTDPLVAFVKRNSMK